jgi:hypothetical protein
VSPVDATSLAFGAGGDNRRRSCHQNAHNKATLDSAQLRASVDKFGTTRQAITFAIDGDTSMMIPV